MTDYSLFFERISCPGSGFATDCDKDGNILEPDKWSEKVAEWKADPDLVDRGIQESYRSWVEPMHIRCDCGREIVIHNDATDCECGRWYNLYGQELSPPHCWGEETGEDYRDILRDAQCRR